MNDRINEILLNIAQLESELRNALHEQENRIFFQIKGRKVEFEHSVLSAHRRLKTTISCLTAGILGI